MRRTLLIAVIFTACSGPKRATQGDDGVSPTPAAASTVPHHEVDEAAAADRVAASNKKVPPQDVAKEIREINSDKYGRPPIKFRKGHVAKLKPPTVKKTTTGFEVQFRSGAPVATPAVYKGKVFVSGGFQSKEFHALYATTGKSAWSISLDDDGPSSPACSEGVCVFNTESCTVFAVDAETGKQLWSWWLGDPLTSAPTIAGGRVFTSYPASGVSGGKPRPPNATHAIAAFDLRTGKILWQQWLDADVMSAPVAKNGFVYASTFAGTLIKFEQKTGKIRYAMRAKATSAPVVTFNREGLESTYYTRRGDNEKDAAEEMIIRADHNKPKTRYKANAKKAEYLDDKVQDKSTYAAESAGDDAANGFSGGAPATANPYAARRTVGQSTVSGMQAFQGSRILHLGKYNINTLGDEVVATSAETGKKMWSHKLKGSLAKSGGFLGTAPLAAGESVVMATLAGEVVELDPGSGKVRSTHKIGHQIRTQPVVVDGWIYVGTANGRLVAINTRNKKLTGWPMWGGNAQRTGIARK